jgi:predicted secreted protein
MAVVNGNDIGLYVEGQLIGCLTSTDFNSQNDEIDVTCKDNDGDRQILSGGNQSSFPFAGLFNPASSYGFTDLLAIHKNKTRVWVKMLKDDTLTITCFAKLNTLTWSGPLNAGSTFSGTFTVDGGWDFTTT